MTRRPLVRRAVALGAAAALVAIGATYWIYGNDLGQEAQKMEAATAAFKSGQFADGVRLAEPLAARGNAEAETWMGLAYAFGQGVPRDRDRAKVYYLSAQGEQAHKTFYWLAEQYENGAPLVPVDHTEALAWYAAAAEMGDERAQLVLARVFRNGLYGVYPDPIAAAFWERKAGEQE
ncbi:MAG: hypothetical protein AAF495_19335 [Pseudomonadota bacterium]